MGFLNKIGLAIVGYAPREGAGNLVHGRHAGRPHTGALAAGAPREPERQETTRMSNGLKEFLWNLEGLGRGALLDLGPAWQTTLSFFIERGFRVTSEDLLRDLAEFQAKERAAATEPLTADNFDERTPEAMGKRFLAENLHFGVSSFDAVLMWDVLDYLEPTLARQMVAHLTELVRPGGVVSAIFHSKKPERFHRYRVMDTHTLQVLESKAIVPAQKVYQNREIQELFGRFRTMKSFVGRDQLRETLFIK